jgi:hypothetical protein
LVYRLLTSVMASTKLMNNLRGAMLARLAGFRAISVQQG